MEFLSDEQAAAYGQFNGEPSRSDLERFFFLDDVDRRRVQMRRGEHNRVGFAVQVGTVRFLGTFLSDWTGTPPGVLRYVVDQVAPSVEVDGLMCRYVERDKTPLEHSWEIRDALGYRDFASAVLATREFLQARAWTRPERPSQLFDQAVVWLRSEKVLLPGVSVLARLVSEVRTEMSDQLYARLASRVSIELGQRLDKLLTVPSGSRVSELDRLRRAPTRASGPEMVRALDRAAEIAGFGTDRIDVADVPPSRVAALARVGLTGDAFTLRRLPRERRWATLLATARLLRCNAIDDALDLFAVLMASKLIGPAERASVAERLRSLPQLVRASATLAIAARVLMELVEANPESDPILDPAAVWVRLSAVVDRDQLAAAVATVEELIPDVADDAASGQRQELLKRYSTVRPFVSMLSAVVPMASTDVGRPVLLAVEGMSDLLGRKRLRRSDIVEAVVTGSWRRFVFTVDPAPGGGELVDLRAYVLCVLDGLYRALRRRDVYALGSIRWGDPRANLLDGAAWEQARPKVLTALRLTDPVTSHLSDLAGRLDGAYRGLAERLGPARERDPDLPVSLEPDRAGKTRLHLAPLEAVPEPPSLLALRETVARMMPRVDLPEVLLEVDAWTGYLGEFTHAGMTAAAAGSRMRDLSTSTAAVLIAQGCNLGFAPIVKPSHPALTRDRLSHVSQNYVRADTLTAANARLITAQSRIDVAQLWGGGLLASVDGLRFVVPVRSLDAGPNPHYFGRRRGITWLNAINDQVAGIGAVVVTGTMRDSLHVLDVILGRDGGPPPTMIATDTASYSDIVFGLFRMLGYQFSPRLADLPDQRLWRLTLPRTPRADYGPMNTVARNNLSFEKIRAQWPDMLRVAGSLHTGAVAGYELLRMLGRDGNPTPLGAAFAEYGRAAKTLHLLAMCDPDDETYRRSVHVQLTVQESRHRLARKIFHGSRGEIRQRYREGQEDQLAALGLVLNAVVLWNTRYIDAALQALQEQGYPVADEDAARLSPLIDAHLNVHGRYTFTQPTDDGLRPLRDLTEPAEEEYLPDTLSP